MLSNFRNCRERQEARQGAEPVETEDSHPLSESPSEAEALAASVSRTSSYGDPPTVETVSEDDDSDEETEDAEAGAIADVENPLPRSSSQRRSSAVVTLRDGNTRRTFSLTDLLDERELQRRRTTFCVLFAVFILFRMWIQAVASDDFGLLLLCLLGTSWTARFIRHTRLREEELDRVITEYNENREENTSNTLRDLSRLSFQAQLAEAILQSQMEMMQGGYGHPDGDQHNTPGVSDEAISHWTKFQFNSKEGLGTFGGDVEKGGPIKTSSLDKDAYEEPHCSICLGEYEDGEDLVGLPCKHVYHEDCVSSWCTNHIRCPLCNFDLESVASDNTSVEV